MSYETIAVKPVTAAIGAEVSGVDLGKPLGNQQFQEVHDALMAHQQEISARKLKRKVSTRQQVIIDEVGPTVAKGRSKAHRKLQEQIAAIVK